MCTLRRFHPLEVRLLKHMSHLFPLKTIQTNVSLSPKYDVLMGVPQKYRMISIKNNRLILSLIFGQFFKAGVFLSADKIAKH